MIFYVFTLIVVNSCIWRYPEPMEPQSLYAPVVMNRSDFENSIKLTDSKPISNAGKIYVIGELLFVGDSYKGFQVLNNSNPASPLKEKFISIPGATDVAVRNNTLYINQATDLVVLWYDSNQKQLHIKKRVKNVFPPIQPPDNIGYYGVKENEVIVDWKLK